VSAGNYASAAPLTEIGVSYTEDGAGFGLAGAVLTSYVAKVQGGIRCFGDLYDNGEKNDVNVDVAAKETLKIRQGATGCKVTFKQLTFTGASTVESATGLLYQTSNTATFKKSDDSNLYVTVEKGLDSLSNEISGNIVVELKGAYVEKDVSTIKNSELFVATSGSALAAPHVGVEGDVSFFNNKLYATLTCLEAGSATATSCKDEIDQKQPFARMSVWITSAKLEAIAAADRHERLTAMFTENGSVEVTKTRGFSGVQITSQGQVGVTPDSTFTLGAPSYIVIRLTDGVDFSYKVFALTLVK
jgi:hypothetical protein